MPWSELIKRNKNNACIGNISRKTTKRSFLGAKFAKKYIYQYNKYKNLSLSKTKTHMDVAEPNIDQETQLIISRYQKLYNIIFSYGAYIFLTICSFIIVLTIKPQAYGSSGDISSLHGQFSVVPSLIHSGDAYIAKGVTLNPTINTEPLQIDILQGFVSISPEAQLGYGALAEYSGIIMPISINLSAQGDNFSKEYFSTSGYNPEDLDKFIQDAILTYPVKNIQATLYQYKQKTLEDNSIAGRTFRADVRTAAIPIDGTSIISNESSLTQRFGLQCLATRHLTNFFCYKNTEQFIARMPYLVFDKQLDQLNILMSEIISTPYKKNACDNLQYAFSKNVLPTRQWENIFMMCGPEYVQAYNRIVDFDTISYEMQGISNTKLYSDNDLNIFKALSLQQKIYHNMVQKNYDLGTIEVYLTFIQELLSKRQNIDKMYKDMIYLYNNTYLQSALTQIAILNNNTKAMLRLTDVVKEINEGTIKLKRSVNNQAVIAFVEKNKGTTSSQTNLVTFQDLFAANFSTFDNFMVTNQKVDNDSLSAEVAGYFIIDLTDGEKKDEKKILFNGKYEFKNDVFVLASASFPQSAYLETTLNKLIQNPAINVDVPYVYEFVKNNITYASAKVSVCDILSIKNKPNSCSDKAAVYGEA